MHGPPLAGWLLVALCATVGVFCLVRMRSVGAGERRGTGGDALMGIGMAVMALPAGALAPGAGSAAVFSAVFGAAAVRAVVPLRAAAHHLHHTVGALAMVYMAIAMGAAGPEHGAVAAGLPLVTGALLAYYLVYVVHGGATLVSGAGPAVAGGSWVARPELGDACRVCMGIGMFAMLLAM